ncbi:hypothetical protein Fot_55504 [Forsythia ovata]|uniref:Uncharacterized protein n=1 Tax=Forsythia ovata TaxID=205694 RepID=A0ABD1P4B1_9LAMI
MKKKARGRRKLVSMRQCLSVALSRAAILSAPAPRAHHGVQPRELGVNASRREMMHLTKMEDLVKNKGSTSNSDEVWANVNKIALSWAVAALLSRLGVRTIM